MCYCLDMNEANAASSLTSLAPPLNSFTSDGGRTFTVDTGQHSERYRDDPLWFDVWPILFYGERAGKLFCSLDYGTGASGLPRWRATTRELYWDRASDAPTGIGFDVAAFDTAEEACVAWARSADQILDWSDGKPVVAPYGVGVVKRGE